ncbi:hypothetical protein RXV95_05425 [Novosphingobium sp. ZN18A2]|uniref:hypothetical protein n=1 Tax=Novosphingobium sp. ZN18A2 TaxID=3079861 RepID=UPI0030CC96A7
MMIDPETHRHAPAETLFCRAAGECGHSGPAIPLAERMSFMEHFVVTFAAAMTESMAHGPHRDEARNTSPNEKDDGPAGNS